MGAYNNLDPAIAGLRLGIESLSDFIETFRSADPAAIMPYGVPVFMNPGDEPNGYLAHQDTAVITCSGSFTGSDTAIIVTLNGTPLASIGYAVSSATTGAAVRAAILAALSAISGTTCVFDDSAHTFTIFTPGYDLTATLASSGGVTATTAYSSSMIFMGVSVFDQVSYRDSTGGYPLDVSGNMTYFGLIWVNTSVAVKSGQDAYVILASGATQGKFTNVSTNNYACKAIFRSTTTGAGLVLIELRGKQNYAGTL